MAVAVPSGRNVVAVSPQNEMTGGWCLLIFTLNMGGTWVCQIICYQLEPKRYGVSEFVVRHVMCLGSSLIGRIESVIRFHPRSIFSVDWS
jgi:hypothetical protein